MLRSASGFAARTLVCIWSVLSSNAMLAAQSAWPSTKSTRKPFAVREAAFVRSTAHAVVIAGDTAQRILLQLHLRNLE